MTTLKRAGIFSKSVSMIVGLMFVVIGLIFFFGYDPDAYDARTTGTIVEIAEHYETVGDEIELMHTVYIDYSVGGTRYEHVEFTEYNSKMKVGDEVGFFYMSKDPTQIAGDDKDKAPYFGLGFAIVGMIILGVTIFKIVRKVPV